MLRTAPIRVAALAVSAATCALACACPAQQLIGYVPKRDATVTGSTDEMEGQAVLMGAASITAKDHTAPVKLSRGGTVRVCQTSQLKITESREVAVAAPLLFSLDRGAIEIETNATSSDSIMTPDLRFTIRTPGPLDVRLRVARNGDTCVENRGAIAPTLAVSDAFGESMYEVSAGQHVLFEHGSVREVVDHETTPCGCPENGVSMAEVLIASGTTKKVEPSNTATTQHPFPIAQSAELAPNEATEPAAPAVAAVGPQVGEALSYTAEMKDPDDLSGDATRPMTVKAGSNAPAQTLSVTAHAKIPAAPVRTPPPPPKVAPKPDEAPQANNDVVHVFARVLRKLFGRG